MNSDRTRLNDLEDILKLLYEKLNSFERELTITSNSAFKFELRQRIKREILPDIRRYEAEYWELYAQEAIVITNDEAESKLDQIAQAVESLESISNTSYPEELLSLLQDVRANLEESNKSASAKLKLVLPLIPVIASYELEMEAKDFVYNTWEGIKKMIRKGESNPENRQEQNTKKTNVFCSYAAKDQSFYEQLETHLSIMSRENIINQWNARDIDATYDWRENILKELEEASIILILVSPNYLASDYAYSQEMNYALKKHEEGESRVIPIIVRSVDWSSAPFARLQVLPRNAKPISTWANTDEAIVEIVSSIRRVIESLSTVKNLNDSSFVDVKTKTIYPIDTVFKESGVPTVTFIEPVNFYRLKLALRYLGRGLIIEGPSGIGKTTALKEAIRQLKLEGYDNQIEVLSARSPNAQKRLEKIDEWQEGIVAIDDFHLLNRSLKNQLVDRLKFLADLESTQKIIIVGIPHTRSSLVEAKHDVATRAEVITMGKTPDVLIESMIEKGEVALNTKFVRKSEIVSVANGSLNIAQMLCSKLAAREGIWQTRNYITNIECYLEDEIEEIKRVMDLKYGNFIRSFALLGGRRSHTCIQILMALVRDEEGYLSLVDPKNRNSDLGSAIEEFISEEYLQRLKKVFPDYKKFIFYDEYALALVIDDPQLIFYLLQMPVSHIRRATGMSESKSRNKIFISYSHRDNDWLKKLQIYLKPLERQGLIDRWDDTRIKPGMKWRDEIKKAIDSAQIAVLLVSSNFLASDFIDENELPPLLKAAEKEGALILSIILNPCKTIFELSELEQFQAVNLPSKPLSSMTDNERDEIFDRLLKTILDTLPSSPT